MSRPLALALLALCVLMAAPAPAFADITGRATVIDGDTIEVRGERIRLDALDAPESAQLCEADGKRWRCGQQAALNLADRIGTRNVTCAGTYGRTLAICYVGDLDLNGWLVSEGWALAYRRYSTEYVGLEEAAQAAQRGMWRGRFVAPWEWRRGALLADTATIAFASIESAVLWPSVSEVAGAILERHRDEIEAQQR